MPYRPSSLKILNLVTLLHCFEISSGSFGVHYTLLSEVEGLQVLVFFFKITTKPHDIYFLPKGFIKTAISFKKPKVVDVLKKKSGMNMLNNSYASMERNTPNLIMKKFEGENMEAQYLFLDIGLICIFIIGS